MMIAWYFATALAEQYESVLPYLEGKRLSDWVHIKTIQKSVESNRRGGKEETLWQIILNVEGAVFLDRE